MLRASITFRFEIHHEQQQYEIVARLGKEIAGITPLTPEPLWDVDHSTAPTMHSSGSLPGSPTDQADGRPCPLQNGSRKRHLKCCQGIFSR
jgi:hypothetical protein